MLFHTGVSSNWLHSPEIHFANQSKEIPEIVGKSPLLRPGQTGAALRYDRIWTRNHDWYLSWHYSTETAQNAWWCADDWPRATAGPLWKGPDTYCTLFCGACTDRFTLMILLTFVFYPQIWGNHMWLCCAVDCTGIETNRSEGTGCICRWHSHCWLFCKHALLHRGLWQSGRYRRRTLCDIYCPISCALVCIIHATLTLQFVFGNVSSCTRKLRVLCLMQYNFLRISQLSLKYNNKLQKAYAFWKSCTCSSQIEWTHRQFFSSGIS